MEWSQNLDREVRNQVEYHAWSCPDPQGNVIFLGSVHQPSITKNYAVHAEKVSPTGTVLWERVFTTTELYRLNPGVATSDQAGDVYITFDCRTSDNTWSPRIMRIVKLDGDDGSTIWSVDWPSTLVDQYLPARLLASPAGLLFLLYDLEGESFLRCYGSVSGNFLWEIPAEPEPVVISHPKELRLHPSGDVIVFGDFDPVGTARQQGYARRIDDVTGSVLWTYTFDGLAGAAYSEDVDLDGQGNVYVVGTVSPGSGNRDVFVARIDGSSGTPTWERTYAGPTDGYDDGRDVAVAPNGEVYVLAQIYVEGQNSQCGFIRYLPDGTQSSVYLWGTAGADSPVKMLLDSQGCIVYSADFPTIGFTIARFAPSDPTPLWSFSDNMMSFSSKGPPIFELSNGLIAIGAGWRSDSTSSGWESIVMAFVKETGVEAWRAIIQPLYSGDQYVQGLCNFEDGATLVTFDSGLEVTLMRLSRSGQSIWETTLNVPGADLPWAAPRSCIGSDGDVYVVGGVTFGQGYVLACSRLRGSDGQVLWSTSHPVFLGQDFGRVRMTLDLNNDIVAVVPASDTLRVIKMSHIDGSIVWSRTISTSTYDPVPGGIVTDANGDVYFSAAGIPAMFEIFTYKLSGATGVPIWTVSHSSLPGTPRGEPRDMCFGPNGELYVVAYGIDYIYLWRFDRSTGGLMWQATYQHLTQNHDAFQVAVGPDGNPVIMGLAPFDNNYNKQLVFLKADSATGTWLWNHPDPYAGGNIGSAQMSLDSTGDVFYVCRGQNSPFIFGKLSGATGAELLRNESSGSDQPIGITVTKLGTIVVGATTSTVLTGADIRLSLYTQPVPLRPNSLSILTGNVMSGGLPELLESDDLRLQIGGDFTLDRATPPVSVVVEGVSPGPNVVELSFKLEASATQSGIPQNIELYDFVAGQYVLVDARTATTTDSTVEISASDPSRFVQAGTGVMRAKVSYKSSGAASGRWRIRIDQVQWKVRF